MEIRMANREDLAALAALAVQMWDAHTPAELEAEFSEIMEDGGAFFLTQDAGNAVGFAQCQLRHDYVEGTSGSPVGYLEGIFVAEDYRRQGTAKMLLAACEAWAAQQGCREFASNCELHNRESLEFHLRMGFEEANRIICFVKKPQ